MRPCWTRISEAHNVKNLRGTDAHNPRKKQKAQCGTTISFSHELNLSTLFWGSLCIVWKCHGSAFQKLWPEVSSGVPVRAQDSASLGEVLLLLPWAGHSKSKRQLCSCSTLRGARLKCVCVFASFGHSVTSKNGDLEQGYICKKGSKNVTISLERAV